MKANCSASTDIKQHRLKIEILNSSSFLLKEMRKVTDVNFCATGTKISEQE